MQQKIDKLKKKIQELVSCGDCIKNITLGMKYKDYIDTLKLSYSFNFCTKELGEYFSFVIEYESNIYKKTIYFYVT